MSHVIDWLMSASLDVEPIDGLPSWWVRHRALVGDFSSPIDRAVAGGFSADRLGYAFASGYQAACAAMFGDDDPPRPVAFCATEKGSAHPSHIHARITNTQDGWRLEGEKSFVTFGTFAERLIVVASEGTGDDGRNRLRVVHIDVREGVEIVALPPGAFVPEIPHASLTLRDVVVAPDEVLDGDGYLTVLKPFRTVEDVHVHAALLGWLVQLARRHWAEEITERLLVCTLAVRELADMPPSSAAGHVALAGAMATVRTLLDDIEPLWAGVDPAIRSRWERDRVLLKVAGTARSKRRDAAWRSLLG